MTLIFDPEKHQLVTARLLYAARVLKRTLVPKTYTARATFDSATAGAVVATKMEERVQADAWIRSVEYTIRQPHLFAGNILKPQHDYFKQKVSSFEIECESYNGSPSQCVDVTDEGPIPLETFAQPAGECRPDFCSPFGSCFILWENMNLRFRLTTVNALVGDAVPTEIVLTIKALQAEGCSLSSVDADTAMAWMEKWLDRGQG